MRPPRARSKRVTATGLVDWLRLVEVSGPFLTLEVLREIFPQGLDAVETAVVDDLRSALDEWDAAKSDPRTHQAFIRHLLEGVLGYDPRDIRDDAGAIAAHTATLAEHRVTLAPDRIITRNDGTAGLLVTITASDQGLERPFNDKQLSSTHADRMRRLLLGTGVQSGVVTNGEELMLVHAPPGRTATFATWNVPLLVEERDTLRALQSLLGSRRVLAAAPGERLDDLLARSADDEREVTDRLGDQARRSVEILVGAFDASDNATGGALLTGVEPPTLYEAAVAVMMRLIFLLAAEAKDLLPDDGPWVESYAVSPLRAELKAQAGGDEALLARRYDAWPRLCATFRAVHGGVSHDRVRLPGYGGGLFNPNRFPFLERGGDRPARVSNAAVLRILDDLQTLEVPVAGGGVERRPLSFRALGVEQIGHVYEKLLEHWAIRATDPALGLDGSKGKEPEVALADLEDARASGEPALLALLRDCTGRSESALMKALARGAADLEHLRIACDNDDDLTDRVRPFAGLIRSDHDGDPQVFLPGRIYVTERPGGRAFQSHYTPRALTGPIVQHALEPLVYEGPAEGFETARWHLRTPNELLALRVCDIAVGSAAFLVAACRYLAERLVEAWGQHPEERPTEYPSDTEERDLLARRMIAERCLYGVDKNPLAIEIAKVSLWLVTLRKDRPFTFLDHALGTGDSLVGIRSVEQLEALSLDASGASRLLSDPAREGVRRALTRVATLRQGIAATDALDLPQIREKQTVLAEANRATEALRIVADLVVGAALGALGRKENGTANEIVEAHADAIREALEVDDPDRQVAALKKVRTGAGDVLVRGRLPGQDDLRPFHWPLQFPEVFGAGHGGFDCIVGNPPFLGGHGISTESGSPYREYLVAAIASGTTGAADLCAYFFLRANALLCPDGTQAMVATKTLAEGKTRVVGLGQLLDGGSSIFRAIPSTKWPGEANLEIVRVWLLKGRWRGHAILGSNTVPGITSYLTRPRRAKGEARRLDGSSHRAFQGCGVLGLGFVLPPSDAHGLVAMDHRNQDVLFPYLTGEDIQSRVDQSPSRWVINFGEKSEDEARSYAEPWRIVSERVLPERATKDAKKYPRMVNEWWKFWNPRPALMASLLEHPLAFARSRHGNNHCLGRLPERVIASEATVVFVASEWGEFAIIQSAVHEVWVWRQASSMRTDIRYTPRDCFETFPFPSALPSGETAHELHDLRAVWTRSHDLGLTPLTNLINDREQQDPEVARLRELMAENDRLVAAAYGWDDLPLDHGFHDTKIGRRFTMSESAREEIVDRLLELNHERYAEEVRLGLHDKKRTGTRAKRSPAKAPDTGQLTIGTDP
jgi:hypothetical protein